jgi:hypothetical protein
LAPCILHVVDLPYGEPDAGTAAARLAKPQRHVHGDRLLLVENIVEGLARNAEPSSDFRFSYRLVVSVDFKKASFG